MPAATWRAIAPAPSPAVTARLPSGRAASCWSGAGTAASPGAASARCVTAPPTTPPATAGSPSRPRRGRAGDVGRGRVDRITDAGLARQRPDGPTVGATYDPARRAWRRIAPSPIGSREFFSTAWTGRELIMFSGSSGDGLAAPAGAAYDPVSDRWRLLAPASIAARLDHAAVWTGREVLVWGGRDGRRSFGEGAAYDPRADRWGPMAGRSGSSVAAAWTGTRMLVWDGSSTGGRTGGALYDPVRDRWTPITRGPALGATAPDRCGPAPSW